MTRQGTFCASLVLAMMCLPLAAQEPWTTERAVTSIQIYDSVLDMMGATLEKSDPTSAPFRSGYVGFEADPKSGLVFYAPNGDYEAMYDGRLLHRGGFVLRFPNGQIISAENFQIEVAFPKNELLILDEEGNRLFRLDHAHSQVIEATSQLRLLNMDMDMTPELAERLGHPGWKGQFMGTVDLVLDVTIPPGEDLRGACTGTFTPDIDVELTVITGLSAAANEPNGRVAMAPSATLRNVGTSDVIWYQAIAPSSPVGQHPYLIFNFYMLKDGKISQIGQSDVKHAFFSVNSGCSCPGGQILYVGCGDTYGTSTNLNRQYLAPRDELTAKSGKWSSLGSHFDASPVDDFRHHGSGGHDDYEHRLTVMEPDLLQPDTRFFIEAWYLVQDDINILNNIGWREVLPTFIGGVWTFSFQTNMVHGPAIDAFVPAGASTADERSVYVKLTEGEFKAASKVTPTVGGGYRYEYAVMNLDYDPKFNRFSVPIGNDVQISNVTFTDTDKDNSNDWAVTMTGNSIDWVAPSNNHQTWGTMVRFGFESNSIPADISLALHNPQGGQTAVNVIGPLVPCSTQGEFTSATETWPIPTVLDLASMINTLCK